MRRRSRNTFIPVKRLCGELALVCDNNGSWQIENSASRGIADGDNRQAQNVENKLSRYQRS